MTSKYTPGPWTLERDRAKSLSLYNGSTFIGEVYHEVDEPSAQEQANAHLIAAAPELYGMLEKAVRLIQSYENPLNIVTSVQLDALDVLARARGGK